MIVGVRVADERVAVAFGEKAYLQLELVLWRSSPSRA